MKQQKKARKKMTSNFVPGEESNEARRNTGAGGYYIYKVWSELDINPYETHTKDVLSAAKEYLKKVLKPEVNCHIYVKDNLGTIHKFLVDVVPAFRYSLGKLN
jgi:hypothetical protein